MSSTSDLPRLNRRAFVAGAASATVCARRRWPSIRAMARSQAQPCLKQPPRLTRSPGFREARRITSRPSRLPSEKWKAPRRRARRGTGLPRRRCRCLEVKWPGPPPGRGACILSAAMAKVASTAPITMFTTQKMTDGSTPRHCRAAPTTSPSWRMPAGSTRLAASSNRIAIRIRMRLLTMWLPTSGRPSHHCRVREVRPRRSRLTERYI